MRCPRGLSRVRATPIALCCAVLRCAALPTAWPCATVVYRRVARHVARRTHAGLAFLHNARCFHGDLTPNNLMIRGRHCGRPRPPSGPISHPRARALQHTNRPSLSAL
jgi:hypothetical protein